MTSNKVSLLDTPPDSVACRSLVPNVHGANVESPDSASDTETSNSTLLPPNSEDLNSSADTNGSSIIVLEKHNEQTMSNEKIISVQDDSSLSLALNEIMEKVSRLSLENEKLKWNLKQKDSALRKQFHTIVILEKEVIQICENYKQKFSEAKDLIVSLKSERAGLLASLEFYTTNNDIDKVNGAAQRELEFIDTIQCLTQSLRHQEALYFKSQTKLEEVQKLHATELELFSEHLKNSHTEIEELKQKLVSLPDDLELSSLVSDKCKKDLEMKYLMEIVTLLKQDTRLAAMQESTISEETFRDNNLANDLLLEKNTEYYKIKLHKFIKCFVEKCVHYLQVEEFPNQCKNVTNVFNNVQLPSNNIFMNDSMQICKEYFVDYRKMLIDDQLQIIKDEKTAMCVQRKFLKALSDYDNFVAELEKLKSEYLKFTAESSSGTEAESNFNNLAEIERCLVEEKRIFDSESLKLAEERTKIEKEKESIEEEKDLLEDERNALLEEKSLITEEITEMRDENERFKKDVYSSKRIIRDLNDKNRNLNRELTEMRIELVNLKEELENKNDRLKSYGDDSARMCYADEIAAYTLQLEMQKTYITELQTAEGNYLHQIESLSTQVHQLEDTIHELRNAQVAPLHPVE